MASAEQLRIAHSVVERVKGVDDRVQGVDDKVQGVDRKLDDTTRSSSLTPHALIPNAQTYSQGTSSATTFTDGFRLPIHPSIIILHPKLITTVQLSGSFKAIFSTNGSPGSPLVRFCGYTENVCTFISTLPHQSSSSRFRSRIREEHSLVRPSFTHPTLPDSHVEPSSSIIQDIMTLNDSGTASMAYFYFDFRDADKQKLQNLLPSLLIQLSALSDSCCDTLFRLYSSHKRGVRKPDDRAMIVCLKEMLTLNEQCPTYIILDAIDECPLRSNVGSPRDDLLDFINELVDFHLPNVHICITSRPEVDIRAVLDPLAPHAVSLHNQSGQKQDIADYVRSFVETDRRMRKWRDEDKDLVIKTLPDKADGMYVYLYMGMIYS